MDKKEQKPEFFEPQQVIQCADGYIEVYKNFIGFGDGKWEPVKKN